jgi:hypothetical protein
MLGISLTQGVHQVAQKLTRTALPAKSAKSTVCPDIAGSRNDG